MQGKEIIERLIEIKKEVLNVYQKKAMNKIDYLIDDIYMYKNHSL